MTLEQMSQPCPLDICDGDGIVHRDDGTDGAYDTLCPHTTDKVDRDDE